MIAPLRPPCAFANKQQVKLNFGSDKDFLLQQYRFALEQALAKSNFIISPDLTIAQAFIVFLVLVRRHDDTRFCWTLTGLMTRVSQALGLHRDGTHFPNLSPFEVEIRRRVFWAVCVLDLRSAEDQGTDLTVMDGLYDTQAPLNINDADISPESTELPKARDGPTDMTFSLIRYEICSVARRLHMASCPIDSNLFRDSASTLEEREALLLEVHRRVEETYLKSPDIESKPMFWTAANIARLIVAKMRLIIYQAVLFPGPGSITLAESKRVSLFNAATEVFEYSYLLNTDPRAKQWRWLFQTYTQLHAVAYVLIEISHRPWSATVERSWDALNMVFSTGKPGLPQFDMEKMQRHSAIWLPLRKLYLKAKRHRETEIARLRGDSQSALKLELEDRARLAPDSFGALSNSVKNSRAIERWRKLVNAPPLPPTVPPSAVDPKPAASSHPTPFPIDEDALMGAGFNKPDIMDYLDSAMANPNFNPTFFPTIWSGRTEPATNRTPDSVYGIGVPDVPGLGYVRGSVTGGARPPSSLPHTQSGAASASLTTSPLQDHHNLPPWMWPDNGNGGLGNTPPMPSTNFEDVNMDEGSFDWQSWQESLGRFELETNGGGGSGTGWGTGI